jgi:hypothetical protein
MWGDDPLDIVSDACDAASRFPDWRGQQLRADLLDTAAHDLGLAVTKALVLLAVGRDPSTYAQAKPQLAGQIDLFGEGVA